jgi:O-antigen/teichoic acid export membrane protein
MYYFFSLVAMRGSGILAKILLARSITPSEYGLITLIVLVLPGIMQIITNFCFFDVMGHATEGRKYFGFSLIYGIVTSAIIGIVFFLFPVPVFTFLNIPMDSWSLLLLIFIVVLFAVTIGGNITGILRGVRNHTLAASFSTAPSILRVIFILIAIYLFGITNFNLILGIFALPAIIVLIPVIILKRKIISSYLHSVIIPTKGIMAFGFSFFILNAWLSFSQHINSLVISHDLGLAWQGYYDVSLSMVAVITFFSSAIYLISAPETTVQNNRSDILEKRGGFGDIGKILFSMCLMCVIILFFYSVQLTTLLFTKDYSAAGDYLTILAIGYTILFVQQYIAFLNISVVGGDVVSRLSLFTIVSLLIFPFFTHFMILYFNFIGVYLATTIFIIFYTVATIILIKDRTPLYLLLNKFDRLLLSVIVTVVIIYFLHFSLIPGIVTSIFLFTLLLFASGYLDKKILMEMVRVKGKNA